MLGSWGSPVVAVVPAYWILGGKKGKYLGKGRWTVFEGNLSLMILFMGLVRVGYLNVHTHAIFEIESTVRVLHLKKKGFSSSKLRKVDTKKLPRLLYLFRMNAEPERTPYLVTTDK